jgi:Holliday junction DNA helicase RuvB
MWKIKGTVRYFISIFAITFVQIGVFIYTQKVIAGTANDQVFLWESLILQGLFLLPYIFMIVPASYFSNKFSKQKVLAFSSLFMTLAMIAMEDFRLDIMLDSGPAARSVNLPLKRFTLVGATTRSGLLTGPLRDRFGLQYRLELYTDEEIKKILLRSASILGVPIDADAAKMLCTRCRNTPRIANRVLRRCRDVAQVRGKGIINLDVAEKTLSMLGIDSDGLDPMDRKILGVMIEKFNGGPVGLGTIGAALGEEPHTIEEVYEPYLIQNGFLARTPRGRVVTLNGYKKMGVLPTISEKNQAELFL